jgi:hypothetical protein
MLKIDDNLLQTIGLGSLPTDDKRGLLTHIYETLEMRVGMRLADQMTNEQLDEFETYFEAKDDAGAFKWLETNFPNYKEIVNEEFEKLKGEVQQSAPQILAAAQANPAAAQQAAPAPQPLQPPAPDPMNGPTPVASQQAPWPTQPQQPAAPAPDPFVAPQPMQPDAPQPQPAPQHEPEAWNLNQSDPAAAPQPPQPAAPAEQPYPSAPPAQPPVAPQDPAAPPAPPAQPYQPMPQAWTPDQPKQDNQQA